MLNIAQNSRDAMTSGGILRVSSGQDGDHSFLEFSDNGPGISPNLVHRIFEPFYTTKPNGTGLGLSLAEQIMTENNGSINVKSSPNGTLVRLTIPEGRSSEQATPPPATSNRGHKEGFIDGILGD